MQVDKDVVRAGNAVVESLHFVFTCVLYLVRATACGTLPTYP